MKFWILPVIFQGACILIDELFFHQRRILPLWERVGHPLDSLFFLACLVFPLIMPFTPSNVNLYLLLSILSCFMISKDEWVHQSRCSGTEHWLHSVLFIIHPIILIETFFLWECTSAAPVGLAFIGKIGWPLLQAGEIHRLLLVQSIGTGFFAVYQIKRGFSLGKLSSKEKIQNQ